MLEALGSVPGTKPKVKCRLKNPNSRFCNQDRRDSLKGVGLAVGLQSSLHLATATNSVEVRSSLYPNLKFGRWLSTAHGQYNHPRTGRFWFNLCRFSRLDKRANSIHSSNQTRNLPLLFKIWNRQIPNQLAYFSEWEIFPCLKLFYI